MTSPRISIALDGGSPGVQILERARPRPTQGYPPGVGSNSDESDADEITDAIFAKFDAFGSDFDRIEPWEAVVVRIYSAQGVIDNGGYRYFFEANFPGTPDYSVFVDAYRAIGCEAQADDLARVVTTFGFPDPHRDLALRLRYIEEYFDDEAYEVVGWGDALCGDPEVWTRVATYARSHASGS